jgi:hypothetical protein
LRFLFCHLRTGKKQCARDKVEPKYLCPFENYRWLLQLIISMFVERYVSCSRCK